MKKTSKLINNLIFDSAYIPNLDMADEATAALRGEANVEIKGVSETIDKKAGGIVRTITILNEQGEAAMGRPQGKYINIEAADTNNICQESTDLISLTAEQLRILMPQNKKISSLLIVGLGNKAATPDALGPLVVTKTMATRHIFRYAPEKIDNSLASVCAVAPGGLGNTGIETAEIIKALSALVQPDAVIAVDSLASASISRVGTTIQLSNTGLAPGGGVGNKRMAVNNSLIGVPIIAIGVPTVVDCTAIIGETISVLQEKKVLNLKNESAIHAVREQMLENFAGNLTVTPKNIDDLIDNLSTILAGALAIAIHPGVTAENYNDYLN